MRARAPVTAGRLNGRESYCGRHRRRMNAIKDSIKSGRTVVGTTVTPNVDVSILADAGYDFLLFDTQHSAWEIKQLQPSIQTMRDKQAAPLVRVAANQAYQICFALDAGARGIVVPMVNTSAEAEAAVRLIPATQYSRRERPSRYRANSLPRKGRRFAASRARRHQIGKSRRFFPGLTRSPRDHLWMNLRVENVSVQTALSTDRRLAIRGNFH